jgi:hypothetical protein
MATAAMSVERSVPEEEQHDERGEDAPRMRCSFTAPIAFSMNSD